MTRGLALVHEYPCVEHECDACSMCEGGRCCRGDDPDYCLPAEGSWQPVIGCLGVVTGDGERQECHACGQWFAFLGKHAWSSHDLTADEYRAAFGLSRSQPLAGNKKRAEARRVLSPYADRDGRHLAAIRPTPERIAMLSSRPHRKQSRLSRLDERRELVKIATAASLLNRTRHTVFVDCVVCGQPVELFPSQVKRGYKRHGACQLEELRDRATGQTPTNAKLTPAIVREIRDRAARGDTQRAIAADFGVTQSHVSLIVRNQIWKRA